MPPPHLEETENYINMQGSQDDEIIKKDDQGTAHKRSHHHHHHHHIKKPETYRAILKHALAGGLRSYVLGHLARGGLNFFLHLLLVFRKRKSSILEAFRHGFFGTDAYRFGAVFGGFSFLWKLINNSMRLARGKEDHWNGLVAGSIAGLAIVAEKRERRITLAQQVFVRALQGAYNAGHAREYFNIPHGDSLLFMITCGQVLYAYTMQPDTIPQDFLKFMIQTARVPAKALRFNRLNVRGQPLNTAELMDYAIKYKATPKALDVISKLPAHPPAIPCALVHPRFDSCKYTIVERFYKVFKPILPVYAALNTVSMLVLGLKLFIKNPKHTTYKASFNTIRSSIFLAMFVTGYQTQVCLHRNLVKTGYKWNSKYFYWLAGFITSLSIFIENKRRRVDLALYVLPKAAESWYKILYSKNWIFELHQYADVWFFSAATGVIMAFYQQEPEVLSHIVKSVLHNVVGKN